MILEISDWEKRGDDIVRGVDLIGAICDLRVTRVKDRWVAFASVNGRSVFCAEYPSRDAAMQACLDAAERAYSLDYFES